MLVSAVQQSESTTYIHISPLLKISSHVGQHTILSRVPYAIQSVFTCYFTYSSIYIFVNPNFPIHPTNLPPWYPYVSSLHLCLYFCFTNKFIYTIFLDYSYNWYKILFSSFWQTWICMKVSTSTHIPTNGTIFVPFYGWVIFSCIYIPHLLYRFCVF